MCFCNYTIHARQKNLDGSAKQQHRKIGLNRKFENSILLNAFFCNRNVIDHKNYGLSENHVISGNLRHIEKVTPYRESCYFNLLENLIACCGIVVISTVLLFDNLSVKLQFDGSGQQTEVCWTLVTKFFSKVVIQGQNVAINLMIATFILYH